MVKMAAQRLHESAEVSVSGSGTGIQVNDIYRKNFIK